MGTSWQWLKTPCAKGVFRHYKSVVPQPPPLPKNAQGRRLDVFEMYRQRVAQLGPVAPINAYAVRLHDATLATRNGGNDGTTLAASDGTVLEDLFLYSQNCVNELQQPAKQLDGLTAAVCEAAAHNYYHFTSGVLPRISLILRLFGREVWDHLLINTSQPKFVRDWLDLIGVPHDRVITQDKSAVVRCSSVVTGSAISMVYYPNQLTTELIRDIAPRGVYHARRLYFTRQGLARSVTNEEEILDVLRPLGFEVIRSDALTLLDQILLFSSADCVIGPHGSWASNIVYAHPGLKMLEMFSPRSITFMFWFWCNACGHDYATILARGDDPPLESNLWRSDHNMNLEIDPKELRQSLAQLGIA